MVKFISDQKDYLKRILSCHFKKLRSIVARIEIGIQRHKIELFSRPGKQSFECACGWSDPSRVNAQYHLSTRRKISNQRTLVMLYPCTSEES